MRLWGTVLRSPWLFVVCSPQLKGPLKEALFLGLFVWDGRHGCQISRAELQPAVCQYVSVSRACLQGNRRVSALSPGHADGATGHLRQLNETTEAVVVLELGEGCARATCGHLQTQGQSKHTLLVTAGSAYNGSVLVMQ